MCMVSLVSSYSTKQRILPFLTAYITETPNEEVPHVHEQSHTLINLPSSYELFFYHTFTRKFSNFRGKAMRRNANTDHVQIIYCIMNLLWVLLSPLSLQEVISYQHNANLTYVVTAVMVCMTNKDLDHEQNKNRLNKTNIWSNWKITITLHTQKLKRVCIEK